MMYSKIFKLFLLITNTILGHLTITIFGGRVINKSRLTEPDIVPKVELITDIGLNVPDLWNNHFLETCELNQQIAMEIEKEMNTSLGTEYEVWQYTFRLSQGKEKKNLYSKTKSILLWFMCFLTKYLICLGTHERRYSWQGIEIDSSPEILQHILTKVLWKPSDLQFCPLLAPSLSLN